MATRAFRTETANHRKPLTRGLIALCMRGVDYEGAKRAFLREVHPDGTAYTEACVVDAHRGVGAKYRAPVIGIHASTPRAAPVRIADMRASA
jgi:hypothetical protein